MESWSKGIFESMRGDITEAVRREAHEVGLKEGREEGREENVAIFTLFADGKSDEDVLEAFPELTPTKVEKMRQQFEELKNRMSRGS